MVQSALQMPGVLRVQTNAQLQAADQAQADMKAKAAAGVDQTTLTGLASYIRTQFEMFRRHRDDGKAGWNHRLLAALRAFNGEYDPEKLAAIRQFGGSEVYARVVAMKCRGASSLLRDVYLNSDRPWGLSPPADPDVPQEIIDAIKQLITSEVTELMNAGQQFDPASVRDRTEQLLTAARDSAKKKAAKQAAVAEDKIQEILEQGNFYRGVAEFLVDLPLFPFACIKGPTVRIVPTVSWGNGKPTIEQKARMFWARVSPFDLYWTPGVSDIEDAAVIERTRVTRADLNDLLDLPGYNTDAIREVLDEYGRGGLHDNWDTTDSERAAQENRESPQMNRSGLISCLEFHGNVQGRMLHEQGFGRDVVPDPVRDYMVQAWLIGRHVIKVQLSPSPRKRHPYYITSFEKVPGTPVGNGLPDILSDIGEVANATLRSLVNNLSIASGPQVVINDDRLAPGADGESLYPWKRWHVDGDPLGNNSQAPISFFQPTSNAQELLATYQAFNNMADELSAIPKYLSGSGPGGGAGRTASGLAMLMGNASKILQTVAANVDRDVFEPAMLNLFDILMLTDDSGLLSGEEQVRVLGVSVAIQRETQRARQLEFLQTTANPIDSQIMGAKGRAKVLKKVSEGIGLPGEEIIPDDQALDQMQQQNAAMAAAGASAQGGQQGSNVTGDMGPRTSIAGGVG